MFQNGPLQTGGTLEVKTIAIISFALCGFANFGSIGAALEYPVHIVHVSSKEGVDEVLRERALIDIDEQRLSRVYDNLKRLGMKATVKQGDGRYPSQWCGEHQFDRILLDAPCFTVAFIRRRFKLS